MTLGHRAALQAAGLTTFAGTFDAGVRADGIVGLRDDLAKVIHWDPETRTL